MIHLEQIKSGQRIMGIVNGQCVEVIAVRSLGSKVIEVTYKVGGIVEQTILLRESEENLEFAETTRRFSFDGDGHRLRLVSEAQRIRLAHLFDPYLAVRSSRIEPMPHQLSAVYEEMLPRQSLRFLLADDPGAGKTIMAGLLIKELMIRGDLERCLVVAPGGLVEQWQDELRDKFSLDFDILTRDQVDASASGNIFNVKKRLIAKLDMLARSEDLKQLIESSDTWDLIVCDEAHRMSASFFGRKINYTKRYRLGRLLGSMCRHFLLMTATPHNGKEDDFQLFMQLLDPDRFERYSSQKATRVDVSDTMRRLTKEELRGFDGKRLFPERKATTVSYELSGQEMELYEAVTHYVREGMNRADQIGDENERRRNNVGFALQTLQRRLASSPAAIHESLKRRILRLEERLEKGGNWTEQEIDDDPEDEYGEVEERIVDEATAARTIEELRAEIHSLMHLEQLAGTLRHSGEDAKWRQLDRILDHPLIHDPGRGVQRKIVIFTEARDTLMYLAARIRGRTGEEESVALIHGGVSRDDRRSAIARFNDDPRVRFLIANDAAGEGVNLQRGAHLMVNYDLPWNPNRLEQRFGRIHRIGQTEMCHLWNLVAANTREGVVYARLLEKLETARVRLGGKVYDVLGELLEARPLRDLLMQAIRVGESAEVRNRLFQVIDVATEHERIKNAMAASKLSKEGFDVSLITEMRDEMERADARRLQPHYIRSFFAEAFKLAGGVMYPREKGRYEIKKVPPSLRNRFTEHSDPVLQQYDRICFDKAFASGKHQAVLIAPGHPLLDVTLEWTLEQYQHLFGRGAILVDENDFGAEPRILVYLSHSIRDGYMGRNGRPRIISKRLQFVFLDRHGASFDGGPAPYLDCRPLLEDEKPLVQTILKDDWLARDIEVEAKAHTATALIAEHLREVKPRRLEEIERTEAAVEERLGKVIWHWERRVLELEKGNGSEDGEENQPEPNSSRAQENARENVRKFTERLDRRKAELAKERQIVPLTPEVLGAALVVPVGWFSKQGQTTVSRNNLTESRAEVEQLAMKAVMDAEQSLGRRPRDVSGKNRGYDIESEDPDSRSLTFIEVKGRAKDATNLSLTRNEMLTAFNKEASYILAVVQVDKGRALSPAYVRDPAAKIFDTEPGFVEVSRVFDVGKVLMMAQEPQ